MTQSKIDWRLLNVVAGLGLGACAPLVPDESAHVDVELVNDGVLVGTIVGEEGLTAHFEVLVGSETPVGTRDWDVPDHEVDVRFTDKNGAPFLMQIGGHTPMDPTWFDDLNEIPPVGDRAGLLELVPAAVSEALRMGASDDIVMALEGVALAARTSDPEAPSVVEELNPVAPPLPTYTQRIYRKKKAAWNLSSAVVGEHSAVYVYIYDSSGSLVGSYYTCNHGTCANSNSMNTYATNSFTTSGIVGNYMCSTSWGLLSGQHTCNDDTLMQYYVLSYNNTAPSSTTCSDSSLRRYAP